MGHCWPGKISSLDTKLPQGFALRNYHV
ncbi:UNVERIFIED_CONTAM: hypothetical protein GTU68_059926 [Idotea baltica]|nr:hypothetical protein [Idotea baltica]